MSTVDEKDVQALEEHLQGNPDSILFARLADVYLKSERTEDAIRLCEEGTKKHPYYTTGHFVLGKGYLADKQYEQAEKEFKRVLLFDPKYLAAHKSYGDLMREIGWENTCESSYKKILDIDPLDDVARSIAGEYVLQGSENEEEAEAAPETAVAMDEAEGAAVNFEETTNDVLEAELKQSESVFQDESLDVAADDVLPELEMPEPEDSSEAEPEVAEIPEEPELTEAAEPAVEADAFGIETPVEETAKPSEIDDLGPLPVSNEEEALMFDDPPQEQKSGDEQPIEMDDVNENKADEFSYLLDDIFKEDSSEEKPVESENLPEMDAIDELIANQPDNGDDYSDESESSDADKHITEVESQEQDPVDEQPDPVAVVEPEPEPVLETEPKREPPPVKAKKSSSEKIVTPTLGEIYSAQGQYAKAIDVFETLLKKYPENEVYLKKISQLKEKLSETKNAS
jgi:tetratricopeptide (TPR) repeat protein